MYIYYIHVRTTQSRHESLACIVSVLICDRPCTYTPDCMEYSLHMHGSYGMRVQQKTTHETYVIVAFNCQHCVKKISRRKKM